MILLGPRVHHTDSILRIALLGRIRERTLLNVGMPLPSMKLYSTRHDRRMSTPDAATFSTPARLNTRYSFRD